MIVEGHYSVYYVNVHDLDAVKLLAFAHDITCFFGPVTKGSLACLHYK